MNRRHVVLLTYGEPPSPAFGAQLTYSWRILLGLTRSVAPIPAVLLPIIALSRGRSRNLLWTAERYASPLEAITGAQARELDAALRRADPATAWDVHVAYEFRDPSLTGMLERLPAGEPVDIVPMYAADSAFTHQISRDTIARWARGHEARARHVRVLPALDPARLVDVSVAHVERELEKRHAGGADWALVLAAHGTLLEPPRPMETGLVATQALCDAIRARLAPRFGAVHNGWLNHTRGGRWTEPPMEQALRDVASAGYTKVVYYPYGFLADNAESELEGRVALRAHAWQSAFHLPCLNAAPDLAGAIAEQVIAARGTAPVPVARQALAAGRD